MKRVRLQPVQVINADARRAYASLLREFCRGGMTNFAFDDAAEDLIVRDDAVHAIHQGFVWYLYCDLRKHTMKGRIDRATRRSLARCIMLLRSDFVGPFPPSPSVLYAVGCLAGVLFAVALLVGAVISPFIAVGVAGAFVAWCAWIWFGSIFRTAARGDPLPTKESEIWPFISPSDYAAALHSPRFLAGIATR